MSGCKGLREALRRNRATVQLHSLFTRRQCLHEAGSCSSSQPERQPVSPPPSQVSTMASPSRRPKGVMVFSQPLVQLSSL